jgi:SAM-dependent methyltransferase
MNTARTIDEQRLGAFVGKVVTECAAALSVPLVVIGDRLGLYRALAEAGPLTSTELAERTGTKERYIRDWLVNQAAGEYLVFDPATNRYGLPNEHAIVLTDESSPYFLGGAFQVTPPLIMAQDRICELFRTGDGMAWGDHDHDLFPGAERFWRSGYLGNLVDNWIPSLDGVKSKLETGVTALDVGCGHGAALILLAKTFPRSHFFGFDAHAPSIEAARSAAREAGVADRVIFDVTSADSYPGTGYDLITFFDSLHDMGNPVGAIRHARETLAPNGSLMIVEPMAGQSVEENFNPIGRAFSAFSVLCCTPNAIAQGDIALGTIATDQQLADIVTAGGFSRFTRVAASLTNRVFQARP